MATARLKLRPVGRTPMSPVAWLAATVLALITLACLAAPWIAGLTGVGPDSVDILNRLGPPSAAHPLGTDDLGRDLLQRLLLGGQVSLMVGVLGAVASALVGGVIGVLAGYVGGRTDDLLMRFTDSVIALPALPVLIVLAAVDFTEVPALAWLASSQADTARIVFLVTLFGWTTVARVVRAQTLSLRRREFIRAAEALGMSPISIMARHIAPNVLGPVIVATTLAVGNVILLETTLSFLGLGIQPPTPSWGGMLSAAQDLMWQAPHLAVFPGLAIFVSVVAINLVGDGLLTLLDRTDDALT
ncbi:MAG: ABC transporter permease [Geminicoccaceae bacterium]